MEQDAAVLDILKKSAVRLPPWSLLCVLSWQRKKVRARRGMSDKAQLKRDAKEEKKQQNKEQQ